MSNLVWQALGVAGHVASVTLLARATITLDLRSASYNYVKVYPSILFVQNAVNDGSINVSTGNGISRSVAPLLNYRLDVSPDDILTITNIGKRDIVMLIADSIAAKSTDISLLVGGQAPSTTPADLLFHFDALSFLNSGVTGCTTTTGGPGTFDTNLNVKFGGAAAIASGGFFIKSFNAGFFDFSKDFTIDMQLKPLPTATVHRVFSAGALNSVDLLMNTVSTEIFLRLNGADYFSAPGVTWSSSYKHIALTKSGTTWRVFLNGVLIISAVDAWAPVENSMSFSEATAPLSGYIDECRYTRGIAVWTSSFTPPAEPYF